MDTSKKKIAYFCYKIFRPTHNFAIFENIFSGDCCVQKTSILDSGSLEEGESSRYSGKFNSIPFIEEESKLSIQNIQL